jgi:hypothetical protein
VPESLFCLLPTEPQVLAKFEALPPGKPSTDRPSWRPASSHLPADLPLAVTVAEVLVAMRTKQPSEHIQTIIDRLRPEDYDVARQMLGEEVIATNLAQFKEEVFVYGVLLVGAKSFSHVLNAIER